MEVELVKCCENQRLIRWTSALTGNVNLKCETCGVSSCGIDIYQATHNLLVEVKERA